ncbi:MAG: glycosyltransferase family 1 protein [Bryobacteraceae bacterium]|nr:glycosyltransferase family 1 protein [Bryobacteraceae bacterium]
MRVLLAPIGTRGDVQPLVALGLALRERGHDVVLGAPANFDSFAASFGLPFTAIAPDYSQFLRELAREPFLSVLARQVPEQFDLLRAAADGADAIVGSMLQAAGPSIAERMGARYYFMLPAPVFVRSEDHPPVTVRRQNLPRWANDLAWRYRGFLWNRALRDPINRLRARIDLSPIRDAQDHVLHSGHVLLAYDSVLVPTPSFRCPRVTVTGSWHLDSGELDPQLAAFCERRPKPVFVGFGSMIAGDPRQLLRTILDGVTAAGQRAVIGAGWSGLEACALPEHCLLIGTAPFHRLFPAVAASIHHGGAGTTAAAARAGIPQAIVPHFSDQYFWGEWLFRRGLGPRPVPIERLTSATLASTIRALVDTPSMRREAERIAGRIVPSESLAAAVRIVESPA